MEGVGNYESTQGEKDRNAKIAVPDRSQYPIRYRLHEGSDVAAFGGVKKHDPHRRDAAQRIDKN